jgi:hypothetical protein
MRNAMAGLALCLLFSGACGGDDDTATTTTTSDATTSTTEVVGPPEPPGGPAPEGSRTAVAAGLDAMLSHLDGLANNAFHATYEVDGVDGLEQFEVYWKHPHSRIDATYRGTVTRAYVDATTGELIVCATGADGRQACTTGDAARAGFPPIGVIDPATGAAALRQALGTPGVTTATRGIAGQQADCALVPQEGGGEQELCVGVSGAVLFVRSPSADGTFRAQATDYVASATELDVRPPEPG